MSWLLEGFKAVSTITTDVVAKTTKIVVSGAAEVAGVFDETAKKNMQYVALEAEKQIRRNVLIDAINDIGSTERELTKQFIRYIDMIHDIDTSETKESFIQRIQKENIWKWSAYAYIPYLLHECVNNEVFQTECPNIDKVCHLFKPIAEKANISFDLLENHIRTFFSSYRILSISKDMYFAASEEECIIGFCGTVTTDLDHLTADISIGNLVAGYHYKMADLACGYYEALKSHIELYSEKHIRLVGHSLGSGIAQYMNILLYMLNIHNVTSYGFGVPCVLPRVFKNRISHRMIHVIDERDVVTKLYKNENIAHVNHLIHIDGLNYDYRYIGMFHINFNRFNPTFLIEKIAYDNTYIEHHYMKNYINICKYQTMHNISIRDTPNIYPY